MTDIVTKLDDTDPAITYEGKWRRGGRPRIEYDGTTHGTKKAFSSAQLTFNGNQIKIFATLDARNTSAPNPISDILLDGELALTYNPVLTSLIQFNQSIYSSRILENGQHTVNITSKLDSTNTIWIDHFEILSSESVTSGEPITTSSLDESSTSSIPSMATTTDSGVGAGTDQNTVSRSTALPIGGIVGLILGVLLLISVLFIGLFLWRRSRISARNLVGYNSTDIQAFPYHLEPSGGSSVATRASLSYIQNSSTSKESPRSHSATWNYSSVSEASIGGRRLSEYPPSYSSR